MADEKYCDGIYYPLEGYISEPGTFYIEMENVKFISAGNVPTPDTNSPFGQPAASIGIESKNIPCGHSYLGYIKIEKKGVYSFLLESDDGAISEAPISLSIDGDHPLRPSDIKSYELKAGYHRVIIKHYNKDQKINNYQALAFHWDKDLDVPLPLGTYTGNTPSSEFSKAPIVPLWRVKTIPPKLSATPVLHLSDNGEAVIHRSEGDTTAYTIQPTPETAHLIEVGEEIATDTFRITANDTETGTATLQLMDSSREVSTCDVIITKNDYKDEDECECDCKEGSKAGNECISFSLAFGRSPHLSDAPSGRVVIKEREAGEHIYSPAIIHYEHPLMRKIVMSSETSHVIADGRNRYAIYEHNRAGGYSSGIQIETSVDNDGLLNEKLSDGTKVFYNANGEFERFVTFNGVTGTPENIGIDIVKSQDGDYLSQIWSAADGLLDITTGTDSFVISWYKNSQLSGKDALTGRYLFTGSPIKTFTFEKPTAAEYGNALRLTERRGTTFEFVYDWIYIAQNQDWTFRRGNENVYATHVRALNISDDNQDAVFTDTFDGSDSGTETTVSNLSTTSQGNRYTGSMRGGVSYFTATRDSSSDGGGQIASETDRSGRQTSYEYDSFGRVSKRTSDILSGMVETTLYTYPEKMRGGNTLDTRPASVTKMIDETSISLTEYQYTDDFTTGRSETETRTANGVSQTTIRRYWPASGTVESGRLQSVTNPDDTMTLYEYSACSIDTLDISNYATFSYTETITEGIRGNSAAEYYFRVVNHKSTRRINTYDAAGNIVRTENYISCNGAFRLVSWVEHTYNPMHKIIESTYSDGKTSSSDWICTGPVFEIDTDGIRTDYTYDALKRCVSKVRHSPNGDVTTSYTYDSLGRVLSTTVSGGTGSDIVSETTSQTYDIEGRIASQTDARGLVTVYAYSDDNLTATETLPNGATIITTRNPDGRISSVTGTAGTPVFYTYSVDSEAALEITEERYGASGSARFRRTYTDGFGNAVKIEESAWNGAVKTTLNTYNNKGQLVETSSTGAPTLSYSYDELGNLSAETISDGETSRILTHAFQYVTYASTEWAARRLDSSKCSDTSIVANSTYTFTQLSGFSNSLERKTEFKNVRSLSTLDWSSFDPVTKVRTVRHTEPGASTGTTTLVRDGQTLSETDAAGVTTTYTYDALGRRLTSTDGRGNTTSNIYNARGELVSVTDAANNTTLYGYSATTGELVSVTDANGKTVNFVYDLTGRKVSEYGASIYPVSYEYNIFGDLVKHFTYRNPGGVIVSEPDPLDGDCTTWIYDESSGLLASKTYADGKTVSYTYDVKGALVTRTWSRLDGTDPLVTSYAYNIFGDLLSIEYSDNGTPNVYNTYNALGMLISTTDASGATSFAYTNYRETASEANAEFDTSLVIGRDNFGRETSSILSLGETALATTATQYSNANGRITRGTFDTNQFNYTYLTNSHLLSQITTCGGAAKKVFAYEANRDLPTEIAFKLSNNTLIAKRNYTFDALGRVSARTQTRGNATAREDAFGYNDRSEVISATLGTDNYAYNFDNIGNRITAEELTDEIAYTSNDLNQYTAIEKNSSTPFVPTFDDDGNQLTVQTATGVWTVTYNAENRPITFTKDTTVIECKYDANGRRFEKKVTDNGAVTFWQRYVYKGYLQIASFDVTVEIVDEVETKVYTLATTTYWDPTELTATRPLAFTDYTSGTPTTYYYTHDLTKNVCEILSRDGSTVSVVTEYDYTPFGAVTSSNTATANTIMFSSEVLDPETSLVYYNYRHYNPTDGRWINRDPLEEEGGVNLYLFALEDPISIMDYNGEIVLLCIVAVGCAAILVGCSREEQKVVEVVKDNIDILETGLDVGILYSSKTTRKEKEDAALNSVDRIDISPFKKGATMKNILNALGRSKK